MVIQLGLAHVTAPALAHDAQGVLGGGHCHLLLAPLVGCTELLWRECLHLLLVQVIAETPAVLLPYVAFATPLVVAPPHVPQGEELLHLVAVVGNVL